MTEVLYSFILAGIVILAGFFGHAFFDKNKIPDVIALIAIGIILGPVSGLASAVLATLPAAAGVSGTESFVTITFGVIIVTNILLTIGMFFIGPGSSDDSEECAS
ncbi:MAG: hypothetical protein PHY09_12645 [Desulfuromonadaceae bacterium]|nr:hypothetical protein [Desulfuromonadaceae bacterium]MDD5105399.1 hypothetical protein [Desulfuromonadaceae bacterium]